MHSLLHTLVKVFLDVLEALFGIGLIGSTIVLIMSFWDDMETLMGRHQPSADR